jgi:uncharacterized membrane protein
VLLAFSEIRHFIYHGDIYRNSASLAELALQVSVGLAMTIGLERLRLHTRSMVHDVGALVVAALTLMAIVLGLAVSKNPLLTGEPVGGSFVNLILLGYGLPAVLAAVLALQTRGVRPRFYSATAAVTAVALALAYLSLEVRALYHGEVLSVGPTSNAEQYTYSAVWLAFGVVLLAAGVLLRSQPVRFASAAVVILTVLKVFLVDMHDLTGILPRPLIHRAWRRAAGHRLALPAPSVPTPPGNRRVRRLIPSPEGAAGGRRGAADR